MEQPVVIDDLAPVTDTVFALSDVLELEWFETRKRRFTRATLAGVALVLQLKDQNEWYHGEGLFFEGELIAVIRIKTCLTIQFTPLSITETADFCYYIGNRHLPVYLGKDKTTFIAPYDGKLFEQLEYRYPNRIRLLNDRLVAENTIRNEIKNITR